jgi:formate-dependent nitrite reductase cytochrome c552 subunit
MFNGTHVSLGHGWRDLASFNSSCAWCHATGIDNETWTEVGVGCLACHDGTSPYLSYDGEVCGDCHNPEHHETATSYPDWEASVHADSMTDLRTSDHASSSCMHCQATESFIHQQNPGDLASFVNTTFDVDGDYTSISCPACHSVHSNWSMVEGNGLLRANDATELCSLCHVGDHHPQYQVWEGGPHDLAGVECISCHGYQLIWSSHGGWTPVTNHTFALNATAACGQDGCHEGDRADWAITMMEARADAYTALTGEIEDEATSLAALVDAYNVTTGANYSLSADVYEAIDAAELQVDIYNADKSMGMHDGAETFTTLNAVFADLLNAKAMFYKLSSTAAPTGASMDMIIIIGGAAGGLVLGLVLGVLVGRRR